MEIKEFRPPHVGERFRFRVSGGTGPTRIEAYIDRNKILDTECPDPPCHEIIRIPPNARGKDLLIIVADAQGNKKQKKFVIDESSSEGGTMSAAG